MSTFRFFPSLLLPFQKNSAAYLFNAFICLAFFSFFPQAVYFISVPKWFVVADFLRSLLIVTTIMLPVCLFPPRIGKIWLFSMFILLITSSTVNLFHILVYNTPLSSFAIQSIIETTPSEAGEFLHEYVTVKTVFGILFFLVSSFYLFWRVFTKSLQKSSTLWQQPAKVILLLLGIVMVAVLVKRHERTLRSYDPYIFFHTIIAHKQNLQNLAKLKKLPPLPFTNVYFLDKDKVPSSTPKTYVIIVGEAANRNHWGLYGYHRDTTPLIQARKNDLIIFSDVISAATHTIPSLNKILVYDTPTATTAFHLFKQAGFSVYWLSNQTVSSENGTGVQLLAANADEAIYLNRSQDEGRSAQTDAVLLPALQGILEKKEQNKVIFVHMIGSHLTYSLRYPPDFAKFTTKDDISTTSWRSESDKEYVNAYDNSLLFSDFIISKIITMVEKVAPYSFVLYFSDHGQEVYDTRPIRGQLQKAPTKHMLDIPYLLWFSDAYKKTNPEFIKTIITAKNNPFVWQNAIHTLADLARISFDEYEPEKSFFAPEPSRVPRLAPNGEKYDELDK